MVSSVGFEIVCPVDDGEWVHCFSVAHEHVLCQSDVSFLSV